MSFPSIDQVHIWLDEIAEEIPKEFFKKLNGGIILSEDTIYHPESVASSPLYILGQYRRDILGKSIYIFYGSFYRVYRYEEEEFIREKLRETLIHEFIHHLEGLAGEKGLEIEDEIALEEYRRSIE